MSNKYRQTSEFGKEKFFVNVLRRRRTNILEKDLQSSKFYTQHNQIQDQHRSIAESGQEILTESLSLASIGLMQKYPPIFFLFYVSSFY